MIRGVHHLAVSTPELDRLVDCYTRWFGFEAAGGGGWEAGDARIDRMLGLDGSAARYAFLRLGNLYVEAFEFGAPAGRPIRPAMSDHGITHLCLYCDDVVAEHARLSSLGMRFHCPPGGSGATRATYGRDCDGNVVELLQIVDPRCPFGYDTLVSA